MQDHQPLLYTLAGASLALFVATLLIAPAMLVRIPPDYFAHPRRPPGRWAHRGRFPRVALLVAKNALGYLFVVAGLAMLALPGQGLLTLILGFLLVDFPGKYRTEKWIVSQPRALRTVNWLRRRRGREPLQSPSSVSSKGRPSS